MPAELGKCFKLRTGQFNFHPLGENADETFPLRCHVAMPFVQSTERSLEDREKRVRTDDMRRAFNSPFWPHILATTSVGQEGLDFHAWCDTLVHRDLGRNPVDLEQREGRIQRFGGLAVRRAIASQIGIALPSGSKELKSLWKAIEAAVNGSDGERPAKADDSGLQPWWICPGGTVRRFVFDVPTSEQAHWLSWVKEQRLLYRLALGQSNQEDLLEVLARSGSLDPAAVRDAVINLSPYFSGQHST